MKQERSAEATDQNIMLQGQHYDENIGLIYNRYRHYDSATGSYLSQDPIGLKGGINPFLYSDANPLNKVDPLGLLGFKLHGNWCGPNWTGGHVETYTPNPDPNYYAAPIDMVDKACMNHDICYYECRKDFSCSLTDRGTCMTECDRSLAEASKGARQPSNMSIADKQGLQTWMSKNNSPDPGLNSNSCPMPPSNMNINQLFNSWPR